MPTNRLNNYPPSVISATTPKAVNTSTSNLESIKPNKTQIQYPELYKNGKLIQPEKIQETALKMTQKLAKLNYRDTEFLINAANEERNTIMAHAMYYQLGRFDPSNQFVKDYRNKDVLQIYKEISKTKQNYENILTRIYITIHTIEKRVKLNKSKNNDKIKNKSFR